MSGAVSVARIGERRISSKISVKVTEGKRLLANPRLVWEDYIIMMLKN
jgi:hypothetical protein